MIKQGGQTIELKSGHNKFEVQENIPIYFQADLRHRVCPGKIMFTYIDPGTNFIAYLSYKNKVPDEMNHDEELLVYKTPSYFILSSNQVGREEVFTEEFAYISIYAE